MEPDIKVLLSKYWNGDTSIEEEKQIKEFFKENRSISPEGMYFKGLEQKQNLTSSHSWKKPKNFTRWSVAASVSIGLLVALLVFKDASKKEAFVVDDPKEALEITRNALMMVSSGLNEGTSYSAELNRINFPKEEKQN